MGGWIKASLNCSNRCMKCFHKVIHCCLIDIMSDGYGVLNNTCMSPMVVYCIKKEFLGRC